MNENIIEKVTVTGDNSIIEAIKRLYKKRKMIWVPEILEFCDTDSELFAHRTEEFLKKLEKLGYLEKRGNLDSFDVYRIRVLENSHSILNNYKAGKKLE